MRNRWIRGVCLAGLFLALGGCAASGPQLTGAWEMLDDYGQPTGKKKILTEDHFAFGAQHDDGGIWAGGGTWTLVDDVYFETIEYHSQPAVVGKTVKFDCKIIDGLWYHEGSIRAGRKNLRVNEVWRRVEKNDSESE